MSVAPHLCNERTARLVVSIKRISMKSSDYMAFVLLLLLSVICCRKDTSSSNKFSTEYFPNSVGNSWIYQVHDSTANRAYIVAVKIVNKIVLVDGSEATIWEYRYPWGKDSTFVEVKKDSVKIYDKFRIESVRGIEFPLKIFLLPLNNDQRWDGKLLSVDTFYVTAQSLIRTSSQAFNNGFDIYHYYKGPNIEYKEHYFFIPRVGMVKMNYDHYDLGPPTKLLWEVKSYQLN